MNRCQDAARPVASDYVVEQAYLKQGGPAGLLAFAGVKLETTYDLSFGVDFLANPERNACACLSTLKWRAREQRYVAGQGDRTAKRYVHAADG